MSRGAFSWSKAAAAQRALASMAEVRRLPSPPRLVGGVDVAYSGGMGYAALVVTDCGGGEAVETRVVSKEVRVPYLPGFLSFREAPLIFKVLAETNTQLDVLLVNGHGLAHPRRCGLATYVGVVEKMPTVGVAAWPLRGVDPGTMGRVDSGGRTLYVSVGNLITLEEAVEIVGRLSGEEGPTPLALAHRAASAAREGVG